jgi:hypothetical protein
MPNKCSECGKEIVGNYATLRISKGSQVTDLTDIFCIDCAMDIQQRLSDHSKVGKEVMNGIKPTAVAS